MIELITRPLSVVAHDAGAANHIFAWLGEQKATLCLEGPARSLWLERLQNSVPVTLPDILLPLQSHTHQPFLSESGLTAVISGAATVITGTGWESDLEHSARKMARERCIRSIAVLDHWVNYSDRFIRNGVLVLPDEIWVTDTYAVEIAQATFPTVKVLQQPNSYLEALVAEVKSFDSKMHVQSTCHVLYVLEPIRDTWGELVELGEFLALDYFMAERARAGIAPDAEIRLRPHPSDSPRKYNDWIDRQDNPMVSLDRSSSLAEALSWANVVVGCQTYAMVLALACGRTVISSIPPWAPPCSLPQLEIRHLSRMPL